MSRATESLTVYLVPEDTVTDTLVSHATQENSRRAEEGTPIGNSNEQFYGNSLSRYPQDPRNEYVHESEPNGGAQS